MVRSIYGQSSKLKHSMLVCACVDPDSDLTQPQTIRLSQKVWTQIGSSTQARVWTQIGRRPSGT